jgi:hypothetical protein
MIVLYPQSSGLASDDRVNSILDLLPSAETGPNGKKCINKVKNF